MFQFTETVFIYWYYVNIFERAVKIFSICKELQYIRAEPPEVFSQQCRQTQFWSRKTKWSSGARLLHVLISWALADI